MQTEEIVQLTRKNISQFLASQSTPPEPYSGPEMRRKPRWPFPGTVEFRPSGGSGQEHWMGTLRNVSETGLGMSCDRHLIPGMLIDLAFHTPEISFVGKGVIRYCKEVRNQFMAGVEFLFDE